jgi:hypothetical protein
VKQCSYCYKDLVRRFGEKPSHFAKRKTCGAECGALKGSLSNYKAPYSSIPKEKCKFCTICGDKFVLIGHLERSNDKKTCSPDCANLSMKINSMPYKSARDQLQNTLTFFRDIRYRKILRKAYIKQYLNKLTTII